MVTPSTNPPQFWSSRSAGSHVPGKAVLSKAEAGKRKNIKNLCPILSCRQGVARHCPLGSCQSCSCPWETRPVGERVKQGDVHPSADIPSPSHSHGHPRESPARQGSAALTAFCWGVSPSSPEFSSPLPQGYHNRLGKSLLRAQDFPPTAPGC